MDDDIQRILDKYKGKIEKDLGSTGNYSQRDNFSQDYRRFRKEALTKKVNSYEMLCNFSERTLNTSSTEIES